MSLEFFFECVIMCRWTATLSDEVRSSTGRLFHVIGPDTAKSRRPTVVLVRGMTSVPLLAECSCHLPTMDETGIYTSARATGRHQTAHALEGHHCELEGHLLSVGKPVM